jgi:hypothetical protein
MDNSHIEDELQNFWEFVKLESRRISKLEREIATIKKTLSEILDDRRQRLEVNEGVDE